MGDILTLKEENNSSTEDFSWWTTLFNAEWLSKSLVKHGGSALTRSSCCALTKSDWLSFDCVWQKVPSITFLPSLSPVSGLFAKWMSEINPNYSDLSACQVTFWDCSLGCEPLFSCAAFSYFFIQAAYFSGEALALQLHFLHVNLPPGSGSPRSHTGLHQVDHVPQLLQQAHLTSG